MIDKTLAEKTAEKIWEVCQGYSTYHKENKVDIVNIIQSSIDKAVAEYKKGTIK